jgi:hypothetical protein
MEEFYQLTKCDRRTCGSTNIEQTSFSEIHGYFYVCHDCGYACWGGKAKNRAKNEKRPPCPSPTDLRIDHCEVCQIPRDHLMHGETLETHHRTEMQRGMRPITCLFSVLLVILCCIMFGSIVASTI